MAAADTLSIYESDICPPGKMLLLVGTICVGAVKLDDPITVVEPDFDGVAVHPSETARFKQICTAKAVFH